MIGIKVLAEKTPPYKTESGGTATDVIVEFHTGIELCTSSSFHSNPEIREAISQSGFIGKKLGHIIFEVRGNMAQMQYYFPLGSTATRKGAPEIKLFQKKGIANLLEYYAIHEALKHMPNVEYIQFAAKMSNPHKKQMNKRGLRGKPFHVFEIKDFLTVLRKRITATTRKNRPVLFHNHPPIIKRVKKRLEQMARKNPPN